MWGDVDEGDDFLSDLAAAKGAKTDNPFQLLGEGAAEDQITKAIILGNFEKAVNICLKEDRIADAFILANCGGKELVEKVQTAYLSQKKGVPSYLRLINSVIGKNLWDVVYNADLDNWKEAMVTLCTFAEPAEFPDLCEALGDRVYESGSRKDASFCYLVGSKLEKVVDIWIAELQESEQAGLQDTSNDSNFSIHARSLQHFIEKVTVFRHVTKFADNEKNLSEGWKLASLYTKYTEYADIVAAHGQLAVAQRYLDLLPTSFPAAEVARNRVKLATQKAAPQVAQRQVAPTSRAASRAAAPVGYHQAAAIPPVGAGLLNLVAPVQAQPAAPALNHYAPPATSHYQPPGASPYAPAAGYGPLPSTIGGYGPPQPFSQPAAHAPPPPRSTGPPPKINKDVGQWNDVPIVAKPPPRRSTPSVAPITAPFPGQIGFQAPGPAGPYQRSAPTPPPPPPKGSAPPRGMASPPNVGLPSLGQFPLRPASGMSNTSTNPYAPPPPPVASGLPSPMAPPPAPRTASPYNPPPAGAPPPNRYAPAPSAQPQYGQGPALTPLAPPPSNPYAPAPSAQSFAPPPQHYSPAA